LRVKAGVLFADRDIRVGEMPEPTCGPDEVLIESASVGLCGSDLHIYRGELRGRVRHPAVLGHELGGTVVEVGSAVRGIQAGDRVAVDPIVPCQGCVACLTGRPNACRTLKLLGVDLAGGLGRYVAASASRVHRLPDSVPFKHAPMVEVYGLAHHILSRGRVQPGESIALLGAGKLGLAVLDVLRQAIGPAVTLITDVQPVRLAVAKKLGADAAVDITKEDPVERALALTDGVGVDCVIEAVGHFHEVPGRQAPLAEAVRMVRSAGRIVTAGLGEQLSPVPFKTLVLKEAEIIASRTSLGEMSRALHLLGQGRLHPDLLITDEVPLREITAAFAKIDREAPDTIKVVVDVGSA
jgi:threonine dehydrogenase-like Zn-dependent dehydrogenase